MHAASDARMVLSRVRLHKSVLEENLRHAQSHIVIIDVLTYGLTHSALLFSSLTAKCHKSVRKMSAREADKVVRYGCKRTAPVAYGPGLHLSA